MPSLFRRKPADPEIVEESVVAPEPVPTKARTPGKGKATPKRPSAAVRRVEPPAANRREAARRIRDRQRAERAEQRAGMMAGDERFLLPRDRGPERALVRDVVDSRRTVGTWFFGGALLVLVGSSAAMPPAIRLGSNILWVVLALGVVVDSLFIARKIRRLVAERFPKTDQRMGSLYMYGIMRGLTFRGMRMPKARVKLGERP